MLETLTALAVVTQFLRTAFLVGGIVLGIVAAADWAVRTRRLNPFGGVARFVRAHVDPRLAGVERQVMRAGGRASATPWWALVFYVVIALLALSAIGMIAALVQELGMATELGAAGFLVLAIRWTFGLLRLALMVRVLSSWIPSLAASRWISWSYGATQ